MAHANPGMAMVADILRIVNVAHPDVANPPELGQFVRLASRRLNLDEVKRRGTE